MNNLTNQFENALLDFETQEEQKVQQAFAVMDLGTAVEAQRRIAYFEGKKREINQIIEEQIAPFLQKIEKIKEWGQQAKVEYEEKQSIYAMRLEMYLREEVQKQLDAGKKPKKTLSLPYGKISLKAQQPKFEKNEDELFEYAKTNGFIRVKEEIAWDQIKKMGVIADGKMYESNGERIPGITVIEQQDKFDWKLEG